MDVPYGLNPFENDPAAWGASLLLNAEIILACLDTAEARSVAEVGAYAGDLTRMLLLWAEPVGARVIAIDPSPHEKLERLAGEREDLELLRETSLTALEHMELPDVIVIDGDHNYYTVTEELRRITARSLDIDQPFPLLLLHDVCWPHGRRDDYFDPKQIPAEHRQPYEHDAGLYPGVKGLRGGGLPFHWPAREEGGPRNGVLTAIEDFLESRQELQLAVIPTFFGIGVVWHLNAPYAQPVAELVKPYDRNRLIERLERNRVLHLSNSWVQASLAWAAQERIDSLEHILRKLLLSRIFSATELVLRVRQLGRRPAFSKEEIREALNSGQ